MFTHSQCENPKMHEGNQNNAASAVPLEASLCAPSLSVPLQGRAQRGGDEEGTGEVEVPLRRRRVEPHAGLRLISPRVAHFHVAKGIPGGVRDLDESDTRLQSHSISKVLKILVLNREKQQRNITVLSRNLRMLLKKFKEEFDLRKFVQVS